MNFDDSSLKALKDLLGAEYAAAIIKKQINEQIKADEKYSGNFNIELDGAGAEVSLKKAITPELRHKLREIAGRCPKDKLKLCVDEFCRDAHQGKSESELRSEFLAKYGQYSNEDLDNLYSGNYINEEYEYALDAWYLEYFGAILAPAGSGKRLAETPAVEGGRINGIWNTIDTAAVRDAVGWFRTKVGI